LHPRRAYKLRPRKVAPKLGFKRVVVENDVIGPAATGAIGCETTGVKAMEVPGLFDLAAAAACCCFVVRTGPTTGVTDAVCVATTVTTGAAETTALGEAAIGVRMLASEDGCNASMAAKPVTLADCCVVVPLPTTGVPATGGTGVAGAGAGTAGAGAVVTGLILPAAD